MIIGIVDGPYLSFRAFCACSKKGEDLAAGQEGLYKNSISVLLDFQRQVDELWVVWEPPDGTGAELRRRDFAGYKGRRTKKASEYFAAIEVLQRCLMPLGIKQAWPKQGEADDAAFTLVARDLNQERARFVLWCRDKDWFQMMRWNNVVIHLPPTSGFAGGHRLGCPEDVVKELGVTPAMVPAYLALAGDSSDDMPGMPQIGAKRARELLRACPMLVEWILAGVADKAVRAVMAVDANLAIWAQRCADSPDHLRDMFACAHLREVELIKHPGRFDREAARGALEGIGCGWAKSQLDGIGSDDWDTTAPLADDWGDEPPEDDWSF